MLTQLLIIVTIERKTFTFREQINYVLDENKIIGKGPNGTLSLVFDGIKRLDKGEKHLKVTCDNAGGQNKNNATISRRISSSVKHPAV